MTRVIKLSDIKTRPPEHGRIRLGERYKAANGKMSMRATSTFRFTSHDREAIEKLAELYGGTPRPWSDPKAPEGQWEVLTKTSRIPVWLPANAYTVSYERWTMKGIERRCDGARCTTYGYTRDETACLCAAEDERTCKTVSRVQVLLPEIKLGGVWRLETKSDYFAYEAPGMIQMLAEFQERGMTRVDLVLVQRTATVKGLRKHYIVPVFEAASSPLELLDGAAQVRAAGSLMHPSSPATLELVRGEEDDEVVDAEIIDSTVWQQSLYSIDIPEDAELVDERAVRSVQEEDGWDIPPSHVSVKRNPDPNGKKWVRR